MKKSMVAVLNFYRSWISPALPGSCRFAPTCSDYARQAIEVHGPWKGAILTIVRLMKCHPFNAGGYDPVPEPQENSTFPVAEYKDGAINPESGN